MFRTNMFRRIALITLLSIALIGCGTKDDITSDDAFTDNSINDSFKKKIEDTKGVVSHNDNDIAYRIWLSDSTFKEKCLYNTKQEEVERIVFDDDGNKTDDIVTKRNYDQYGNVIRVISVDKNNCVIKDEYTTDITYGDKGQILEARTMDYNGNVINECKGVIEDDRYIVSKKWYDSEELLSTEMEYIVGSDKIVRKKLQYSEYPVDEYGIDESGNVYKENIKISNGYGEDVLEPITWQIGNYMESYNTGHSYPYSTFLPVQHNIYNQDNELLYSRKCEYNEVGNRTSMITSDANGTVWEKTIYTHDDTGKKLIKEEHFLGDYIDYYTEYKYDDRGDLSEESHYSRRMGGEDESFSESIKYKYIYNYDDNTITKETLDKDTAEVISSEIKYYHDIEKEKDLYQFDPRITNITGRNRSHDTFYKCEHYLKKNGTLNLIQTDICERNEYTDCISKKTIDNEKGIEYDPSEYEFAYFTQREYDKEMKKYKNLTEITPEFLASIVYSDQNEKTDEVNTGDKDVADKKTTTEDAKSTKEEKEIDYLELFDWASKYYNEKSNMKINRSYIEIHEDMGSYYYYELYSIVENDDESHAHHVCDLEIEKDKSAIRYADMGTMFEMKTLFSK